MIRQQSGVAVVIPDATPGATSGPAFAPAATTPATSPSSSTPATAFAAPPRRPVPQSSLLEKGTTTTATNTPPRAKERREKEDGRRIDELFVPEIRVKVDLLDPKGGDVFASERLTVPVVTTSVTLGGLVGYCLLPRAADSVADDQEPAFVTDDLLKKNTTFLWRGKGGKKEVVVVTSDAELRRLLAEHSRSQLGRHVSQALLTLRKQFLRDKYTQLSRQNTLALKQTGLLPCPKCEWAKISQEPVTNEDALALVKNLLNGTDATAAAAVPAETPPKMKELTTWGAWVSSQFLSGYADVNGSADARVEEHLDCICGNQVVSKEEDSGGPDDDDDVVAAIQVTISPDVWTCLVAGATPAPTAPSIAATRRLWSLRGLLDINFNVFSVQEVGSALDDLTDGLRNSITEEMLRDDDDDEEDR